jgi:hypothetical protein
LQDCVVTLVDIGDGSPAGGYMVRLIRIGVVVGEVWGEVNPPSEICAIFEIGVTSVIQWRQRLRWGIQVHKKCRRGRVIWPY